VAEAIAYSKAILAGEIPACQLVRRACERFERDLAAAKAGTSRWEFRPDLAEEPMTFAGLLPNIKGPEAGKPLRLMGWQRLIFANLFDLRSPRTSGS
jgi:phage terminase large subunit-like protein